MVRTEVARSTPWFVASTCVAMQMRVVLLLLMSAGRGDGSGLSVGLCTVTHGTLVSTAPRYSSELPTLVIDKEVVALLAVVVLAAT